jgi:hypothetical protein
VAEKIVTDVLDRRKSLKSGRGTWEDHWQTCAETMLPKRSDFTGEQAKGAKRTEHQFDGVPMQAARGLASSVDGLLKPKTQRWFSLKAQDDFLNDDEEAKAWMRDAEDALYAELYDPKARFLQRSAEVDLDLVVLGTGLLFLTERVSGGLLFQTLSLAHTLIAEDAEGMVDTAIRTFRFTARQAEQKFGREKLGRKVIEALTGPSARPDQEFEYVQSIMPRHDRDPRRKDNRNLPFASVVIEVESEHLVSESGFHEFPVIAPRWDTAAGEIYGRSPGMLALPDVKTLHQMSKTILEAGHKAVNPPLLVPDDGVHSAPRTYPGGVSPFDAELLKFTGGRSPVFPLVSGMDLPFGRDIQNDIREQVWAAFFRNVLHLPVDGPQMTATEIIERRAEFMRIIGPTFGRLEADYTGPMVERGFNLLLRQSISNRWNGPFPRPPDSLLGAEIKFEYASPIAKVQKQIDATALRKTGEDILPVVQADPTVLDNFNGDKITRDIADANGLPQDWLRGADAVQQLRQGRAQAAALEQQKQDMERMAAGAKDITPAVKALMGGAA